MRISRYVFLMVLVVVFLREECAHADLFDTFGMDAQGIAMAGARCAGVDNLSALYYNPAGLGKNEGHALGLSYLYTTPSLQVRGATSSVPEDSDLCFGAYIITLGLNINQIVNLPRKASFAFGLSMMDDMTMVRLEDLEEQRYTYVQYGAPIERSAIYLGLGVEVLPEYLYLGVGAHAMIGGDVAANLTLDAQDLSTTQQVTPSEQEIWMEMKMKLNPTAGIIVHPTKAIRVGLSYRDDIEVNLEPFQADLAVNIGSHAAHINACTAIMSFWHPKSYQGGLSYQHGDLTLEVDVTYDRWSQFRLSSPREIRRIAPSFDDVFSYRLGMEYRLPRVTLWSGYQYAPSPVPDQSGESHYLDADRHIVSLGAGTTYKDPWGVLNKPLGLRLAIQDQFLRERTFHAKGYSYTLKGNVICGIISLQLKF